MAVPGLLPNRLSSTLLPGLQRRRKAEQRQCAAQERARRACCVQSAGAAQRGARLVPGREAPLAAVFWRVVPVGGCVGWRASGGGQP